MAQSPQKQQLEIEIEGSLQLKKQDSLLSQCEAECQSILKIVSSDVLKVPLQTFTSPTTENKTTVGLMLEDGVVTNMLTGAPAYMSKKFQKGDRVIAVNKEPVQPGEIVRKLVGEDVPGTTVSVTVQRGGMQIEATLMRASTSTLADRRRMFQLFTKLKDQALQSETPEQKETVDQAVDLWTQMLEASQRRDERIISNVQTMQGSADKSVRSLRDNLSQLHALLLRAMAGSGTIASNEATLMLQLTQMRQQINELNIQLESYKKTAKDWEMRCETARTQCTKLEQEISRNAILIGQYKVQVDEHAKCPGVIAGLRQQIQETTDALQLDVSALEAESTKASQAAAAKKTTGRVRLGAAMGPGGIALPVPEPAEAKDMENKSATLSTVAVLKKELYELRMLHSPCAGTIQGLRMQLEELEMEHSRCADQQKTIDALKLQLLKGVAEMQYRSRLCGVGLKLSQEDPSSKFELSEHHETHGGKIWISEIIKGGSADKNGQLRVDDYVVKVDGLPVMFLPEACNRLRGAPDTTVTVTVERPGPGGIEQELTIKLTRKPPVAITSTLITDA